MKKYLLLFFALLAVMGSRAGTDLKPILINPEEGATYSVSENDGNIVFSFDRKLEIDKAYILPKTGDPVEVTNTWNMQTNAFYYYLGIGEQMKTLMKKGTIKAGDNFSIKLEGIKEVDDPTVSYNDVTATFVAGKLVAELISIQPANGSTINAFNPLGGTEGLITFTFTEAVQCDSAKILYGEVEGGTYGQIKLPKPEAKGMTIVADLRGIKLSPTEINKQKSITLQIMGVKDSEGIKLEGNLQGSAGSYVVNYDVKSSEVQVGHEFTPAEGSNIDNTDDLECYFSLPVTFEGARISYLLGGGQTSIIIPKEKIRAEKDPNDSEGAFSAYVPLKDLSFDAGNVTVEFIDVTDPNGNSVEITGTFVSAGKHAETTTLFSITPDPGSTLIPRPEQFVFTFSDVISLDILKSSLIIGTDTIPVGRLAMTDKNVVTITYNSMMLGDFKFRLSVKNSAGNVVTYGDEEGFVTASYSAPVDIFTCSKIDPVVGKVESLKRFTLTFDEVAEGDYVGGFDTFKEIVLKDEAGEVVTKGMIDLPEDMWTYPMDAIITLEQEVTATGIYTLVVPEGTAYNSLFDDMQDDKGVSMGAVYNPELTFTYVIGDVEPTVCTNVNPAPADNLDILPIQFAFTFSRNIVLSQALMTNDENPRGGVDISQYVTIVDKVLTVALPEGTADNYTFLRLMLQVTDITGANVTYGDVDGFVIAAYMKKVPANTFTWLAITPAVGTVASLKEFTLTFDEAVEGDMVGGFDDSKEIVLKDEAGNTVAIGKADLSDWDHPLDVIITLAKEVETDGTYTLVIPEGTVYNGAYDDMAPDFGVSMGAVYNPELTFTYTVQPTSIDSVTMDELSGIVAVYSIQGVLLRKADISEALNGLAKGIYIVNGKKIAVK